MPPPEPDDTQIQGEALSRALKTLRKRRGLRTHEVASAMGMPLRSYEYFEAGRGRLNLERLQAFAAATDTDPFAILAGLSMGSPELAVRCADNKLVTIFLMTLQDFNAEVGDELAALDARTLIGAFTRLFEMLRAQAGRRDSYVEDWFADKGLGRPPRKPDPS